MHSFPGILFDYHAPPRILYKALIFFSPVRTAGQLKMEEWALIDLQRQALMVGV